MFVRTPHLGRFLFVVLLALVVPGNRARAQDVTEVTLKGAFILNFARFTVWPADALQAPTISVCVVGDRDVADALSRTVKDKQLSGRAVAVTLVAADSPLPTCHVLYLSGLADDRVAEVTAKVRDLPVLTVSNAEAFVKRGGIVQIFVENGKMKFRISLASARRARLALSSRLLALAELVDADAASLRPDPLAEPLDVLTSQNLKRRGPDKARGSASWQH
jgi:hypothetical protein